MISIAIVIVFGLIVTSFFIGYDVAANKSKDYADSDNALSDDYLNEGDEGYWEAYNVERKKDGIQFIMTKISLKKNNILQFGERRLTLMMPS